MVTTSLKLLFFSFSSCLTIERSIVFNTMDRQCESFSRTFSSATVFEIFEILKFYEKFEIMNFKKKNLILEF
jgi:hypothetical protein